jgi:L-alanine-DL-glutamate epimerase-like enolase superfamily enzyme
MIGYLASLMLGRDSRDIEKLMRMMKKRSFRRLGVIGMSAVSGIELALWDILGKPLDQRAWRVLGGQLATTRLSVPISVSAISARPIRGLEPRDPRGDEGAVPWYSDVVRGPIEKIDSFVQAPTATGLRVEVDEAECAPSFRTRSPPCRQRRARRWRDHRLVGRA